MRRKNILIMLLFIMLSLLLPNNVNASDQHYLDRVEVHINGKTTTYTNEGKQDTYKIKLSNVDYNYGYGAFKNNKNVILDDNEKDIVKATDYKEENNKLDIYAYYVVNFGGIPIESIEYQCTDGFEVVENGYSVSNNGTNTYVITNFSGQEIKLHIKNNNKISAKTYATEIKEITYYNEENGELQNDSISNSEVKLKLSRNLDSRIISGNVWDDSKKNSDGTYTFANGRKDDNEQTIKGIKVQLIEIKDNTYYVWNETTTDENGEYFFNNILPGDYIIRFIYGNGKSDIVKKYNGYDYKSTTNTAYQEKEYKPEYYADTGSVARDNEARRLELIALTAAIDSLNGSELKEKSNVSKYYMYADTPKIEVVETKEISNINFGLEERPRSSIELEKHVTALNITANDGTTIIDTKAKIEDGKIRLEDGKVINGTLEPTLATRDKIGKWIVKTDVEEIIQGARLYLEYTYTVKNTGETDYISKNLADEYKENASKDHIGSYTKYLKDKAKELRDNLYNGDLGIYLGSTYYTGDSNATDVTTVQINVGKIEDYIDKNLKFVDVTSSDFKTKKAEDISGYNANITAILESREEVGLLSLEEGKSIKSKKILLDSNGLLSSTGNLTFISYIAQISSTCTSPNGRRYYEVIGDTEKAEVSGNTKTIKNENYLYKDKKLDVEKDSASAETIEIK